MPLPRFDNLSSEKQARILDVASAEFAANGYTAASLNRIVADAGISKGTMYYYFSDKADLYGAVMDELFDQVGVTFEGFTMPESRDAFWVSLTELMGRVDESVLSDPQLASLARGLYREGGSNPVYRRLLDRSTAWIAGVLEVGQAVGAVRTDVPLDLLTEALTGMVVSLDRWFVERMETQPLDELLALMPAVLGLVQDLVGQRDGS